MAALDTQLKAFPCPVCDSSEYRILYQDTLGGKLPEFGYDFSPLHSKHYRVVRCTRCRHAYCSPRAADLYHQYVDVVDEEYLKNEVQRHATARKVLEAIRRHKPGGRLLDIGCATGDFLDAAQQYYTADGLELSQWASQIAKRRGHTIHSCRLADLRDQGAYDVITLWGVIEHFEFPVPEVDEIRRLQNAGGIVCLWTGDMDSWLSRLLGAKWWYVQGQHIQFFCRDSLDRLFTDRGYTRVHLGRYPYVMSLRSIAKSLARYPVLGPMAEALFGGQKSENYRLTLQLPGEMFAIFQKS